MSDKSLEEINYKQEIEKLIKRYENRIDWFYKNKELSSHVCDCVIDAYTSVVISLEDLIDGIPM